MGWFKRLQKGITTQTTEKKDTKEGLWYKCPKCKKISTVEEHIKNFFVCECSYYERMSSVQYFSILFDNYEFTELFDNLKPADPLGFSDTKKYTQRLLATQKSTGLSDAMTVAVGKINGNDLLIASMNFEFIGGSMGAVVGEKISRSVDYCIKHKTPLMIISKSGGARMMEAAFALMQMAKTAAKLTQLSYAKVPFISYLTDPTTGGVTASFAMLGDINIAEPGALIGFAGPRVIKETIKRDLPAGFQTAEFLLEKGFVDYIVERKNLKDTISRQLKMFAC
ncbi:MAG TPA: acetyl-CoA carboxylase carboxyl transferase subunit beta [Bacteroidales bacterium]|nr:acetyl-CoA carboxylase carboxyl transferase subunit beta [Bacteroidales bacterium]